MEFKKEYKKAIESQNDDVDIIGSKTGYKAIEDLNDADQEEVYRFECCYNGIFNYISEDANRIIAIGFVDYKVLSFPCFATIPDLLVLRGRDYIQIRLFDDIILG